MQAKIGFDKNKKMKTVKQCVPVEISDDEETVDIPTNKILKLKITELRKFFLDDCKQDIQEPENMEKILEILFALPKSQMKMPGIAIIFIMMVMMARADFDYYLNPKNFKKQRPDPDFVQLLEMVDFPRENNAIDSVEVYLNMIGRMWQSTTTQFVDFQLSHIIALKDRERDIGMISCALRDLLVF